MQLVLIIDNYDSFTYNLVQAVGTLGFGDDLKVVLHDQVTAEEVERWKPARLIISPGPCTPNESGISVEVVRRLAGKTPILGVCLGHQCIGAAFGARVIRATRIMHGKTSIIHHVGDGIYAGSPNPFVAARYHSLIVEQSALPDGFEATAWTDANELMGMRHKGLGIEGVQFHPESFLTPQGSILIANFLAGPRA